MGVFEWIADGYELVSNLLWSLLHQSTLPKGLWAATMGERSAYMVDSMICILCFSCAVIYSGILGDLITSLLAQITHHASSRTRNIVAVTVAALWPMSLIKNLSALAFTSVLGFCAILYTVLFVIFRSLDGSYALPAGEFVSGENALKLMPSFAKSSMWNIDFSSLVLASNMGLAYIAHYNGPNFYRNLKDTNAKRFSSMVNLAFAVLVLLYSVTMEAGYSTFGDACQGNLLLNYHHDDILSTLARVATLASILFGFPLVMTGAREGFVGAADAFGADLKDSHFAVVTALLVAVTIIACTVQDVSLVVGLTGAAMGSFIVYICPALIYTNAVRLTKGVGSPEDIRASRYLALVPFGAIIGALGVFMTLNHH